MLGAWLDDRDVPEAGEISVERLAEPALAT
jgi:hypothetical protein